MKKTSTHGSIPVIPYPLQWPVTKPRTATGDRKRAHFGKRQRDRFTDITIPQAIERIRHQAGAFSLGTYYTRIIPDEIIFSSNLRVRVDGLPMANQRMPDDPGVAVYFEMDDKPTCIAVDTYDRVADNLAAVAAVLEALRALDRHGSGLLTAAFAGFAALPAPDQVQGWSWRTVFNYDGDDIDEVKAIHRRLVRRHHPDHGGDPNEFDLVNKAWAMAQQELRS